MRLNGKVALITGGGTGIGEAAAKIFAGEGAKVAITGRRKEVLEGVAKAIVANGGKVLAIAGSVTDEAHVQSAVDQTIRTFGKIDILINNAGIGAFGTPLHETTDRTWQEVLDINLTGSFRFARAVIPHMLGRGGAIVNVSSIAGLVGIAGLSAYASTKGAQIALTRALAMDYAKEKIRCNCICPGLVETPMAAEAIGNPEMCATLLADYPLGRPGTSEEIGRMLLYLASDEAAWVTGSVFTIDGGMTAQ